MIIPTQTYNTILNEYTQAVSWIKSLGLDTNKGRLVKYQKVLEYLEENYKVASDDKLNQLFPDVMGSAYEAMFLVDIFKGLKNVSNDNLDHIKWKLKKAIYGPEYQQNETNVNNTARNYMFELLVESILNRPNEDLYVDFKSTSDTAVKFKQKKYFFECKRLQSINQIEKNVRDAINQLEKQIKKKPGSNLRGIIALDFSKAFNPNSHILPAKNDQELYETLDQTLNFLIRQHSHTWQKLLKKKNRKIVAVLVRVSFMAVSEARNIIVNCSQWVINPNNGISEIESLYLQELKKIFNKKQSIDT